MISFASDYIAGAHPAILKRLIDTNLENLGGYGSDKYCESAIQKIKKAFDCPDGEVFLLVGGTQTNQFVISTLLDDCEGVLAAESGHVNTHEAGAIEYTGHKVIELPGENGKLSAKCVGDYLKNFFADANHSHMVFPGMVYISFPTEYGTLYSKSELTDLHEVCKKYNIPLYIDGARLGYGLASDECDIEMTDISKLCDVFYIGGTKVGALCGEAVVFSSNYCPKRLLTKVKQHGALLAKGRLLGIQFDALFTDDLYMKISRHAIHMAAVLKDLFIQNGSRFYIDSPTNQQFIILDNELMEKLQDKVEFSFWEKYDENNTIVRFATSWSTVDEDIKQLAKIMSEENHD